MRIPGADPKDTLSECLKDERTVLTYDPVKEPLRAENLDSTARTVVSLLQPSESRWWQIQPNLRSAIGDGKLLPVWPLLGLAIFVVGQEFNVEIIQAIAETYHVHANNLTPPGGRTQLPLHMLAGAIGMFLSAGLIGVVLHQNAKRAAATPNQGETVSLMLATPGDGTVRAGYITPKQCRATIKRELKKIAPGASIRTAEDITYADWLGFADTDTSDDSPWPAAHTPVLGEIAIKESQPYDGLSQGTDAQTLLENDDTGVLADDIIATLAEHELPALVVVSLTAREHDSSRYKVAKNRLSELFKADISDAAWASADGGSSRYADLCDVAIHSAVFPRAEAFEDGKASIAAIHKSLRASFDGPLHNDLTTVIRTCRTDRRVRRASSRPHRVHSLVRRLDTDVVPYRPAYRGYGLLVRYGLHTRPSVPVTTPELWRYLAVSGDGLTTARQAQGSRDRDRTEAVRPDESTLQGLRTDDPMTSATDKTDDGVDSDG